MNESGPKFEQPVNIVEYQPEDRESLIQQVAELQDSLWEKEPDVLKPGSEMCVDYADKMLKKVSESNGKIYLVKEQEKVVGHMIVYVDGNKAEENVEFLHVSDLNVSKPYQSKGIGSKLLQQAEDYAKSLGLGYLRLTYRASNPDAGRLYEKVGYEPLYVRLQKQIERS